MSRRISFLFFLGTVAIAGMYFFRIIHPFLVPLLMAGTLAMLVRPTYDQSVLRVGGYRRLVACAYTTVIVIAVVLPMLMGLTLAMRQLLDFGGTYVVNDLPFSVGDTKVGPGIGNEGVEQFRTSAMTMLQPIVVELSKKTTGFISNAINIVVAMLIIAFALYYFLAEGPEIFQEIDSLLPLESADEEAIMRQFETICRGIIWGTVVAAVVQAALLGLGLLVLGIPGAWLLTCLTVLAAMIPFVGAASVYIAVSAYLIWSHRYGEATVLFLYGALVVSTSDNVIRAYVIHGTSRMHPLIALISALGALQLVGLWGIFVGPIVAGIFYSLLKILRKKLHRLAREESVPSESTALPRIDERLPAHGTASWSVGNVVNH